MKDKAIKEEMKRRMIAGANVVARLRAERDYYREKAERAGSEAWDSEKSESTITRHALSNAN